MRFVIEAYRFLFARPVFEKLNRLVVLLGLKGLGVLNYQDNHVSGEAYFLRKYLASAPAPVCVDVGANVGNYSEMLIRSNPNAILHCFEPHPKTFQTLSGRLGRSEHIHLTNSACGEAPGELELFDYASEDGSSHASVYRDVIEGLHRSVAVSHRVPVVRLDEYVETHGLERIDLLKVDTEGHELAVLRGAANTIKSGNIACIHLEFNEMNAISRVFFKDIWDFLPDYRLFRLLPSGMIEIRSYSPLQCEVFAFQNIVALRKDLTVGLTSLGVD